MDRLQELMEKWQRKADLTFTEWEKRRDPENVCKTEAIESCIEDLKDTLLLIEADNIIKRKK